MKILYDNKTGKIYYTVKDSDWFYFTHSTNIPLTLLEIDETEMNKELCVDLKKHERREDDLGDKKYSVDKNIVTEKSNWKEKDEL